MPLKTVLRIRRRSGCLMVRLCLFVLCPRSRSSVLLAQEMSANGSRTNEQCEIPAVFRDDPSSLNTLMTESRSVMKSSKMKEKEERRDLKQTARFARGSATGQRCVAVLALVPNSRGLCITRTTSLGIISWIATGRFARSCTGYNALKKRNRLKSGKRQE